MNITEVILMDKKEKFLLFMTDETPPIVLDLYDNSINMVFYKDDEAYKKAKYDKKLKKYGSQFEYSIGSVDLEYILNDFEGDKRYVTCAKELKESFSDLLNLFDSLTPSAKVELWVNELGEGY